MFIEHDFKKSATTPGYNLKAFIKQHLSRNHSNPTSSPCSSWYLWPPSHGRCTRGERTPSCSFHSYGQLLHGWQWAHLFGRNTQSAFFPVVSAKFNIRKVQLLKCSCISLLWGAFTFTYGHRYELAVIVGWLWPYKFHTRRGTLGCTHHSAGNPTCTSTDKQTSIKIKMPALFCASPEILCSSWHLEEQHC